MSIVATFENFYHFLLLWATFCNFLQHLENILQHLPTFGNILQLLAKCGKFRQLSSGHHATMSSCHLVILSSCHLVVLSLSSCHIVIMSCYHIVILSYHHLFIHHILFVILTVWQLVNLLACQFASLWAFQLVRFSACQLFSLRILELASLFLRSTRYYTIFRFLIRLSYNINDILWLIIGEKFVKK